MLLNTVHQLATFDEHAMPKQHVVRKKIKQIEKIKHQIQACIYLKQITTYKYNALKVKKQS
jgi:hypothetical protein